MKKLLVLLAIALCLPACTAKNSTPVAAPVAPSIPQTSPAVSQAEAAPSPTAAIDPVTAAAPTTPTPTLPSAVAPSPVAPMPSAPTSTTVYVLAISDQAPASEAPVPVANEATMRELIAAAEQGDLDKFEQLADSQAVSLMQGGSTVQVLSQKDNLVEVRLMGADVDNNDLTGQTRWTAAQFIFSQEAN